MEHYVGLDVSLKLTAICVVDRTGKIEREGVVQSDLEAIAAFVRSYAPDVADRTRNRSNVDVAMDRVE
jgi:transposase